MAHAVRSPSHHSPIEEIRERYRAVEAAEPGPDRSRYVEALKAFLATAERYSDSIANEGRDVAPLLDDAAMAFYRASSPELAERAIDLGLRLTPGTSSLLHHKALVLLALNRDLPMVVQLVDRALEANPNDRGLWATRGDALRLLGQDKEAADAYLRAQELDASSTQFVDRALKLAPGHPRGLRMKVELSRAGGDLNALAACDELLKTSPDDLELLRSRAELLFALGRSGEALAPLGRVRGLAPNDSSARLLEIRVLFQLGRGAEAVPVVTELLRAPQPPDGATLEQIAQAVAATQPELALAARERLREVEPRNVQNLLDLRSIALQLGRTDSARNAYRAVLATSPDNLEAMRGIAELEMASGHPTEAIEGYRRIAQVHPHAVGELRKALEAARTALRPDAVREFAQEILAVEPKDADARLSLARALAGAGEVAEALKEYDLLLEEKPGELSILLEKRTLLSRSKDRASLAPVLDEIFRLDPTRTDVAIERGNLYLANAYDLPEGSAERDEAARAALVAYERSSGDPAAADVSRLGIARASRLVDDHDRSLRAYDEFLGQEANRGRNDVRKEKAHTLRETGRYAEAVEEYERAISGGLEDSDLFWGAAEVYARLNQDATALRLVNVLLRKEPGNTMFLRRKGQLLLKAGRRDEAFSILQEAVRAAQGDPHAYFEVAEALRVQGSYPDAISYYRRGLELDPKNRHGRLALAETLLLAGQYPEVVEMIDPLLKEDPNDLAAWKARGDAWRALGRQSEVLYSLQAILLLEPDSGPALLEMFRLRRDAGETRDAYEALTRLLRSNSAESRDPSLHLERGDLAAALGLTDEANTAYERAASIDPAYRVEISVRRARLRLSAGRPDLALEVLDDGLKAVAGATPPSLAALLLRAEILGALERSAEARAVYEEVRRREPKSPVAIAGIGRAMLGEGRHADAAEFLRGAIPVVPPEESLYLLLAEAESGLGHLDQAAAAVSTAVGLLPKSSALWIRGGEIGIARQSWTDAANAFAHALALTPGATDVLLRAGFVAERLGHPNEALSFYDRATEAEPTNKQAWTSRGVALLATARAPEAQASFDRALALDSDFVPAKEGKRLAVQKTRDTEIQRYGREALLLETRLRRGVTKNDLFVTLHVPYEFLDPVLQEVGRTPKIDLDRLSAEELHDLENASYLFVSAAVERPAPGPESRGFSLADVASLAPPNYTLDQIQRLFGYLKAVLGADLKSEKLALTPDVEELARKAIGLPPEQRTLFQLVRTFRVGIYKARLIKAVEEAGAASHAPLPSVDLGAFAPEVSHLPTAAGSSAGGERFFAPETSPAPAHPGGGPEPSSAPMRSAPAPSEAPPAEPPSGPTPPPGSRCVGCGGIASVVHSCGVPLCHHCIAQFPNCPKCGKPVSPGSTRPLQATPPAQSASATGGGPIGALKGVFRRPRIHGRHDALRHGPREAPVPKSKPETEEEPESKAPTEPEPAKRHRAEPEDAPESDDEEEGTEKADPNEPPAPPSTPTPRPRRERTDDEPRL